MTKKIWHVQKQKELPLEKKKLKGKLYHLLVQMLWDGEHLLLINGGPII